MDRTTFIQSLFNFLNQQDYLWLKATCGRPEDTNTSSDIDLFIKKENVQGVLNFIHKQERIEGLEITVKGNAVFLNLRFADGSHLKVDLLTQLVRKQWIYLQEDYLFKNRIWKNGVANYTSEVLLEHVMLFNFLNHSGLPDKYISYFGKMPYLEQARLLGFINQKYGTRFSSIANMVTFSKEARGKLISFLKGTEGNQLAGRLNNWLGYLLQIKGGRQLIKNKGTAKNKPLTAGESRTLERRFSQPPKVITFSGVDGAGKTTLLNDLKKVLSEQQHGKVVVLRHRPSILPILSAWSHGKKEAEAKAATTLPRLGKNNNGFSSLLRFSYYFTDYLLGQFYVWLRYTLLGYTVIYDRYYFDFIIDGKRSNITMGERLPKWLYRFIFKPGLNIFLYAEPSVIRQRKQELPVADIVQMTGRYKNLFGDLAKRYSGQYVCIENTDRAASLNTILQHCSKAY